MALGKAGIFACSCEVFVEFELGLSFRFQPGNGKNVRNLHEPTELDNPSRLLPLLSTVLFTAMLTNTVPAYPLVNSCAGCCITTPQDGRCKTQT